MKEEIIIPVNDKKEFERLKEKIKKYSFKQLPKREPHYTDSLLQKDTDEKELEEYFTQFDKIKKIDFRKRKSNWNNYDFYYELDDGTFILYAIKLDVTPPMIINAFHAHTNFKNFLKHLLKKYGKEVV